MLLRPFLNDSTSCVSYLFGCGTHAKLAVVDPHADLVDDYLATAAALGAQSWRSSRHTCKQTTSPAYPRSSPTRARPPTRPPGPGSSSSTSHWPTAMWSSSGTRS